MSVIDVGFLEVKFKKSVNNDGRIETSYTEMYKVVLDDPDTSPDEILNADGLPELFDAYSNDFTARCRSKDPSLFDKNSRLVYIVSCEFSTLTPPESKEQDPEDPLSAPVKRSVTTTTQSRVMDRDIDGNQILNYMYQAYDPPLEDVIYIDVLTLVRNEPEYSTAYGRAYKGKVNSATIAGAAAGSMLCADITATEVTNSDPTYWEVTYVFHVLPSPYTWQPRLLEASYLIINDDMDKVRATDDNGHPTSGPVPIDENGARTLTPVYTEWETKASANFNDLNLPFE